MLSDKAPLSRLSRQVSVGSIWLACNTLLAKALALAAQFAMGWFLSDRDFGVYAIAISVSTIASLLRDGGLSRLLVKRGDEYTQLQGPVFWMMLTFNSAGALVLLALAPAAARFYAEPQLAGLLVLVAVSLPMLAPGAVLGAKLSLDLRYRDLGAVQACSSLLRYGGMFLLGWRGFGAESFLIPVVAVAVFEGLAFWALARSNPWLHGARVRSWPGLFEQTKWLLLGTFAISFMNYGAYFLIGKLVPETVVGVYFFAFQIVLQIGVLLSNNLYQVLFPAFARIAADTERCRTALLRLINIVMFATTWLSLILLPMFAPIEVLIWHGKWALSNHSVQILSVCYPPSVVLSIVMAVQSARGEFKQWGLMTLGLSIGTVLAAGAGAYWGRKPETIALATGGFTIVGTLSYACHALRPFRVGAASLLKHLVPIWLVGCVAALATSVLGRLTSRFISTSSDLPGIQNSFAVAGTGLIFSALYFAGMRFISPVPLRQTFEVLPLRFNRLLSWLFRMPRAPLAAADTQFR